MLERTMATPDREGPFAVVAADDSRDPATRLVTTVAAALRRLPRHRDRVELFFDYWVLGTRHPVVRRKIRRALAGYRESYIAGAQAGGHYRASGGLCLSETGPDSSGLCAQTAGLGVSCRRALSLEVRPAVAL